MNDWHQLQQEPPAQPQTSLARQLGRLPTDLLSLSVLLDLIPKSQLLHRNKWPPTASLLTAHNSCGSCWPSPPNLPPLAIVAQFPIPDDTFYEHTSSDDQTYRQHTVTTLSENLQMKHKLGNKTPTQQRQSQKLPQTQMPRQQRKNTTTVREICLHRSLAIPNPDIPI